MNMQTRTKLQTILEMEESKAGESPDENDSGHGEGDAGGVGEGHLSHGEDDVDLEGHHLPNGFASAALEEREETPLPGEISKSLT